MAGKGSTIGPVIGGAMAQGNWRWIFYLHIPFSVLGFLVVIFLLKVNYIRSPTWKHALARVDYIGAAIFSPSTIAVLYVLLTGGDPLSLVILARHPTTHTRPLWLSNRKRHRYARHQAPGTLVRNSHVGNWVRACSP